MSGINRELEEHPTHNEIQERAYELYLARGCEDGQDIQDWRSPKSNFAENTVSELEPEQQASWRARAELLKPICFQLTILLSRRKSGVKCEPLKN